MNAIKWILSGSALLLTMSATASTTKVGNGDDGGDLEGATAITTGVISETRAMAVANAKALNIQGVPGLGLLIAELEHSQLLLAKSDVNAMSSEGSWESSSDRKKVYARTFAEPHAPTRFFPAALKLNRDQLVALHTHEALHRALPSEIRENEEKVAILTMAITSPYATFDRVNSIAATVLPSAERTEPANAASNAVRIEVPKAELPPPQKVELHAIGTVAGVDENTTPDQKFQANYGYSKVGATFSPFAVMSSLGRPMEPRVSIDQFLIYNAYDGYFAGPLSLTGQLAFQNSSVNKMGPLAQFNLRSLESRERYSLDRDVYTFGAFFETRGAVHFNETKITYTMPSSARQKHSLLDETSPASSYNLGSIWSLNMREGARVGRFSLGGVFELHHSRGNGRNSDPFTIVRIGPDVRWTYRRTTVGLGGGFMMNREYVSLSDLGDLAGHGTGKNTVSASVAVEL